MNRIVVAFKPRFEDQEYKSEFELTLSKKMTYDQVSNALTRSSSFVSSYTLFGFSGRNASWGSPEIPIE